ncbi:PTS mannose/fructose/sorbose transporter subunit IIAB [Lactococcus lactis]|uniref:PTS mannose/fructose/sorbose transporter subunit IIAB n=1 Tax=Lactococcus lactis TaxID=1358 RepID=UPI00072960D1|nr:PTS mannose/fructose/sorbose transporter subunit IIAB [Lactococcus lactis]KST82992.1 PTS system mannose-specific IIB component [Lactococcus lactis subsp. lactis]MCI1072182.1 PTS sugar transporter subunit IIB [Lactococcus lactis]
MRKFAIASHEKMADGVQATLELFVGNDMEITYMCAYIEGRDTIEKQIDDFLKGVSKEDEVIIFTDLYGGSVNQKIVLATEAYENVFIIAGFNLPTIIEVIYYGNSYSYENLNNIVTNTRESIQVVAKKSQKNISNIEKKVIIEKNFSKKHETYDSDVNLPVTLRVDERLVHGQIAMVWSRELNLQGILVANDQAAENETQKMALQMAVPAGISMLVRSIDKSIEILRDQRVMNHRILVLVRTVQDALKLAQNIPNMNYINIGNVGKSVDGKKKILTQFVMLTDDEMKSLEKLVNIYPDTALQNLPTDKKEQAKSFLQ